MRTLAVLIYLSIAIFGGCSKSHVVGGVSRTMDSSGTGYLTVLVSPERVQQGDSAVCAARFRFRTSPNLDVQTRAYSEGNLANKHQWSYSQQFLVDGKPIELQLLIDGKKMQLIHENKMYHLLKGNLFEVVIVSDSRIAVSQLMVVDTSYNIDKENDHVRSLFSRVDGNRSRDGD